MRKMSTTTDSKESVHSHNITWKLVDFWLTLQSLSSPHQVTPLHVAAERGHPRIVEYLVGKGADIDIQNNNGVIMYHSSNCSVLLLI